MFLFMTFGQSLINIFRLLCSFGLALFVERDMVSLHDWDLVRCPGKSMGQILSGNKVIEHFIM